MNILPAIDLKDGNCVRLFQGDFSTAQQVAEDPIATAKGFRTAGATWVHIVDLDGAKKGFTQNESVILQIAKHSGLMAQVGGGVRDMDTITRYLENGVSRVILGSAAVKNPDLVAQAARAYPNQIAVGIDAKNGWVATEAWLEGSEVYYLDLAKKVEQMGVKYIIFTDIAKDGTLQGVNVEQLNAINQAVSCNIIASGGVKDLMDVDRCKSISLYGVICGKSIYTASLSLQEAIQRAGEA